MKLKTVYAFAMVMTAAATHAQQRQMSGFPDLDHFDSPEPQAAKFLRLGIRYKGRAEKAHEVEWTIAQVEFPNAQPYQWSIDRYWLPAEASAKLLELTGLELFLREEAAR